MQVTPSSGQIWNQGKCCHLVAKFVKNKRNQGKCCYLVAKFATNASGTIWWPTLQLVQVVSSAGQICKWCHLPLVMFFSYFFGWKTSFNDVVSNSTHLTLSKRRISLVCQHADKKSRGKKEQTRDREPKHLGTRSHLFSNGKMFIVQYDYVKEPPC